MKGSPPLSRATTLPACASRTRMRLISACEVVGPRGVLPTKMRSASRRAYSRIFGFDQPVDDQHVGLLQALQRLQGEQIGIAGAAADQGHAADRAGAGRSRLELGGEDAAGLGLRAAQDGAAEGALQQPLPQAAAGARIGDALGNGGRAAPGRAAPARRDWRAASVSSRVLISRASTGAAPSVPIATVTGSRSTMAGVMKVESCGRVDDVDGNAARPARHARRRRRAAVAGGGIDEALALQVAGEERRGGTIQMALCLPARAARR